MPRILLANDDTPLRDLLVPISDTGGLLRGDGRRWSAGPRHGCHLPAGSAHHGPAHATSHWLERLFRVRAQAPHLPIILMSGAGTGVPAQEIAYPEYAVFAQTLRFGASAGNRDAAAGSGPVGFVRLTVYLTRSARPLRHFTINRFVRYADSRILSCQHAQLLFSEAVVVSDAQD